MVVFGLWEPKNIKFLQFGAISGLTGRGLPFPERVFWEAFWVENGVFLPHKIMFFGLRGSSVLAGKHFPALRVHFGGFFS